MYNTLEKEKLNGGSYKYFIADIDGNKIKIFGDNYRDAVEVGRVYNDFENEDFEQAQELNKIFYQFTILYELLRRVLINGEPVDGVVDHEYDLDGYEIDDLEDGEYFINDNYIFVKDAHIRETKNLFDNNGILIYKDFENIEMFIPEVGFVLKKNKGDYYCVINFDGDYIIEPIKKQIRYLEEHRLFQIGDYSLYSLDGQSMTFKNPNYFMEKHLLAKKNEILNYEKSILIVSDESNSLLGVLRNGEIILDFIYDNIYFTDTIDLLIVSKNGKFGFIFLYDNNKLSIPKEPYFHLVTDMVYDSIIFLNRGGFIAKRFDDKQIDIILGLDNDKLLPTAVIQVVDTLDEYKAIEKINQQLGNNYEVFIKNKISK
jgi:hypothetical protein